MAAPQHNSSPAEAAPKSYPVRVQNIVISVRMGIRLDLYKVAEVLFGTIDTRKFPAVIVRSRQPTVTFVIFSNGKVQVVGTSHVMDALLAVRQLAQALELKLGYRAVPHSFHIRNVVCSFSLGAHLNVAAFAEDHPLRSVYNSEAFEGCQFYLRRQHKGATKEQSTAFVLFNSGRIVITGMRRASVCSTAQSLPV